MAKILQPPLVNDATTDDWTLSVERSNNELDDRTGSLESKLDDVRTAVADITDSSTLAEVNTALQAIATALEDE